MPNHETGRIFALILSGVLLNACAQLLLKAGTNRIGHFDFSLNNALPIGWQLATNPIFSAGWLLCGERGGLDHGTVASAGQHRLSDAVDRLRCQRAGRLVAVGESLTVMRIAGIGIIIVGVLYGCKVDIYGFSPFTPHNRRKATIQGVVDVLRSGWITSGPKVKGIRSRAVRLFGGRRCTFWFGHRRHARNRCNC